MKNAIILHGKADPGSKEYYNPSFPSSSNSHWLPWLQRQLQLHDIAAHTPEVPNSWCPDYATWQREFERYEITPDTMLVGHSCGGGFLVRWLSEHPDVRVGRVVLVAPWLGLGDQETPEIQRSVDDFFKFEIDPNLAERTQKLTIFNSDNDFDSVQESVRQILDKVDGAHDRKFHAYGHFCVRDMKTEKFPELLEELLN